MEIQQKIKALSQDFESFYLYDEAGIIQAANQLQVTFPEISFLYSMKCNANMDVNQTIFRQGYGADAASLQEVYRAQRLGLKPDQIYYSAPGKSDNEIIAALDKSMIIADSLAEVRRIEQIAQDLEQAVKIGVRINPAISFEGGPGTASKFGIDEDQFIDFAQKERLNHVEIVGLHIHLRSQELQAEVLLTYYQNLFRLARRIQEHTGMDLTYLNMGSGIGIPYSSQDSRLDLDQLKQGLQPAMKDFKEDFPDVNLIIEVGRYLVGNHGYYASRVMDRKLSQGQTFLILKNTLNGFIRPSLAQLVAKYSQDEQPMASEPLFTKIDAFDFIPLGDSKTKERVNLVGNLCTGTDLIVEQIELERLEIGDVLMITNAGAYAQVLSPHQFSSQERPVEILLRENGNIVIN